MIIELIKTTKTTIDERTNDKWETFLDYINNNAENNLVDIPDTLAYSSEFDFYAILYSLNVQERYHYPTMRLNGYRSPCDYLGDINKIRLYDATMLETIYKSYIEEK